MATILNNDRKYIGKKSSHIYSRIRTILETPMYRNNIRHITSIKEAYELAKKNMGTIVSDFDVYNSEELGIGKDGKVLIFNDGKITGRQAQVRRIINQENENDFGDKLRDAVYASRNKVMYHAVVYIGLHPDFMVKGHIIVPEGYENTLYNWMLNFQTKTNDMDTLYANSTLFNEGDVILYTDPDYFIEGFNEGISIFDREHNCAALLGLKYFGEHKKATLTMAWTIASRNGYTACHGGQKRFNLSNNQSYIMGVFGLSGSGKSTITHSKHHGKYDVSVLHDDAFIINNENASSISLEPSYFDKVQDYPTNSDDNKYLITLQNVGVTLDKNGYKVPVTEDIRNGNGRAIKSIYWTPNREFKFDQPVNSIFWIMKDDSLPPILKINDTTLASTFGATLATKRSSAEYGVVSDKLIIEPYANPFRLYPLRRDFDHFKELFDSGITCYVINTGHFLNKKVTKELTLGIIEMIIENRITWKQFGPIEEIQFMEIDGFNPDFTSKQYIDLAINRLEGRVDFISNLKNEDILPIQANEAIMKIIERLRK